LSGQAEAVFRAFERGDVSAGVDVLYANIDAIERGTKTGRAVVEELLAAVFGELPSDVQDMSGSVRIGEQSPQAGRWGSRNVAHARKAKKMSRVIDKTWEMPPKVADDPWLSELWRRAEARAKDPIFPLFSLELPPPLRPQSRDSETDLRPNLDHSIGD